MEKGHRRYMDVLDQDSTANADLEAKVEQMMKNDTQLQQMQFQ